MKKKVGFLITLTLLIGILSGCSTETETIKIGAHTYTEPIILAYMIEHLINEDTDLEAEVVEGLGSTPVVQQAMVSNDIQISSRYVGTDLAGTLEIKDMPRDREKALKMVQEGFNEKFDQTWFPSYGLENTYAFTVRQEVADKLGLEKISDLAPHAKDMALGTDTGWLERPLDGYPAFIKTYGIEFGKKSPMEIGLVYKAVKNEDVDVVLAYSTDPRLKEYNLKTLKDDKSFFPPYDASPVVRNDLLEKHPQLKDIINKLVGLIDTETMTSLNYQVDVEKLSPDEVAKNFLVEKGLLKK
jgi:osmoprotectant transport system substrate-binding protein